MSLKSQRTEIQLNRSELNAKQRHSLTASSLFFIDSRCIIEQASSNKMSATNKDNAEKALQKFFGDITKKSATQQIIIGAASGW